MNEQLYQSQNKINKVNECSKFKNDGHKMETHHKHVKTNSKLVRVQKVIERNTKITQDLEMKRKEVK